jgi:hypothetical protein
MGIENYFILDKNMYKIFTSGSCRLMISFGDGHNMVYPIHTLHTNFIGNNFMGKLHTQKMIIKLKKAYQNFHSNKSKIV